MGYVVVDDGRWVSETFERLARVIKDYDPTLELYWIPPESIETPEERERNLMIFDTVTQKPVFYASLNDAPAAILARIFMGDTRKHNTLEMLDKVNAAAEALAMKEEMDKREEQKDYAAFLIKTPKNYINLGGGRVVDDQLRVIRKGRQ